MIKLIIFDLDGVLVEAKQIHFDTLNQSLYEVSEKYVISETEHHSIYD
jgi:beta-phosphoglucomutase-like phosphatase (HAD superfamily)